MSSRSQVAATGGPNCHGLPRPTAPPPFTAFDTGFNPYPQVSDEPSLPDPPLGVWLFGTQLNGEGR